MNFSFWPFLWFGLPGRLLTLRAQRLKKFKIALRDWNFHSRDWKFQLWGILKVRDWKFQARLKFSISIENFNLAWNFQSRTFRIPHKNKDFGGWLAWNFQSREWKFQSRFIFFNLWALRGFFGNAKRGSLKMGSFSSQRTQRTLPY